MLLLRPKLARAASVLATIACLPGCFDAHGAGRDGGPGGDGGMCLELPAVVESIRCEAVPGGEAAAVITTSPSRCCSTGTVSPSVRRSGTSVDVELAWSACDCCEGCRCIGPIEEVRVPLGLLEPGSYLVRAHGSSCTLEIEAPPACAPVSADEARFARVLFDDQRFVATQIERDETSCGCTPRARIEESGDAVALTMERCGCCDACECIDAGYEASAVGPVLAVGEHRVEARDGARPVTVTTRDRCRPLDAIGLRIVAPDPTLHRAGPAVHWAIVSGTEALCCAEPAPAVDEGVGPAGERALALHSCVETDCACIGTPVSFEAWHALVDLPPGEHVVRAGAFEQTIVVE